MQKTPKLVLDTFSEVYDLLKPYAVDEFWDLNQHEIVPGAVYVVGRMQCIEHQQRLLKLVNEQTIQLVVSNPHEGSQTLDGQMTRLGFRGADIKLISGGDMPPGWDYILYDKFLPEILDYEDNLTAAQHSEEIYSRYQKPWKFLFLNGRGRPHREAALRKLRARNLLENSLWTNLDSNNGPLRTLPPEYEVSRY